MPHATHFLSRLERLTPSQVDLALTLYRAPAVLQVFAAVLQIPADSRLAVALDESASPPHLVIAGDGGFITCLGPGMSTAQLPVIPFEVLNAVMTRCKHLSLADQMVGETGRGFMLHRRMFEPDQLSREAFVGIGAYYDPLVRELRPLMQTFMKTAREYTERAAGGQTAPALLELWWTSINASGHGAMLIARGRPALAAEDIDDVLDVAIRSGHLATVARGLWASVQVGQARWSSCLKHLGGGASFNTFVRCALEVTVHALADTSLRNVTRRALTEASSVLTVETHLAAPAVCSMLLAVLDSPDVHHELFRMASAQLCVVLGERASATSDFRFASGDAVPRSLLGAG
ncbi:MAG: hypothetical protein JNG84_07900, partial [Archangium sp.]|nr:hypothetical protein [Archangium sp.]